MASTNSSSCTNGGYTILFAQDVDNSGTLDPLVDQSIQSLEICNGTDGQEGQDAVSDFSPVAVIDPCNSQSNYDEVLLRLGNGQILASFSENASGKNTRFSLIPAGLYTTTDGTNCAFIVHTNGEVTW